MHKDIILFLSSEIAFHASLPIQIRLSSMIFTDVSQSFCCNLPFSINIQCHTKSQNHDSNEYECRREGWGISNVNRVEEDVVWRKPGDIDGHLLAVAWVPLERVIEIVNQDFDSPVNKEAKKFFAERTLG